MWYCRTYLKRLRRNTNLDSQYSLRIERHGTSAQQHWSNSVNLMVLILEGKKKALLFGGGFSSRCPTSFISKAKSQTDPIWFFDMVWKLWLISMFNPNLGNLFGPDSFLSRFWNSIDLFIRPFSGTHGTIIEFNRDQIKAIIH